MPVRDSAWPEGTPCWVDYGAADLDAAHAFYTAVLGWTYEESNAEYGNYASCLSGGHRAAGMMPAMEPDQPSSWTTYFATADAAASAARVTEAGGTVVVPPMQVASFGTMAIATDPQGNAFGLWQADQHIGAEVYNQPGSLVWNEAAVADPTTAQAFYSAVFGFAWDEIDGMGGYAVFRTGDRPLGGLGARQPGLPGGWSACFSVASTDEAVATVEQGGGKVVMAAQDTDFGRFAVVEDPWGAAFSVMQEPKG
jgi:predicted enzyme related to lactoylglutathione lyase